MADPYHILCVDDEPMIREILRETLEQEGHRVSEAENGQVARDKIDQDAFDLILTDVKMPVMDGFTLMKNLGDLTDEIPVVVITSFGDVDVAVDAIRLGAYDYIVKPFNISQVTISVQRALERRRLLIENVQYKKDLEHKVVEKTIDLIKKNKKLEQQAKLLEGLLRDLRRATARRSTTAAASRPTPSCSPSASASRRSSSWTSPTARCCTTSARSACPTPSSSSPAGCRRRSGRRCARTRTSATR
jgi:DNA-binding NtrC family response regulator